MHRLLLTLLLAPLLLAPVRLKDATPNFMLNGSQPPAPESLSLPPAAPLASPTVIMVSPTLVQEGADTSPTLVPSPTTVSGSTLNLPLPPSPTVAVPPAPSPQPADLMPVLSSQLCQRGMGLVQDLAMLSYQQKPAEGTLNLAAAAAATARTAARRQWPELAPFNRAVSGLPWFYPNKTELRDAITAARRLCERT